MTSSGIQESSSTGACSPSPSPPFQDGRKGKCDATMTSQTFRCGKLGPALVLSWSPLGLKGLARARHCRGPLASSSWWRGEGVWVPKGSDRAVGLLCVRCVVRAVFRVGGLASGGVCPCALR